MFTDEELKPFGWARGGYWMRCKVCGDEEGGVAKRSLQCRCCASQAALAALRAKLTQVEHERDEFKESYRLAMVSVNDAYDKGKAAAEQDRDRLAGEVELHTSGVAYCPKCFAQLIGKPKGCGVHGFPNNSLSPIGAVNALRARLSAAQEENKRLKEEVDRLSEKAQQFADVVVDTMAELAAAQQSAQEQFRKGMERAAGMLEDRAYLIPTFPPRMDDIRGRAELFNAAKAIRAELSKGEGK